MNLNGKWLLTCDDEKWEDNNFGTFDTKEEIISYINENGAVKLYDIWLDETGDEPSEEQDAITFYIGQVVAFVPGVNVDSILDDVVENAYEHGGEYAEGYLQYVQKEQQSELEDSLNDVLSKWIEKHNFKPHFYQMASVEGIELKIKS